MKLWLALGTLLLGTLLLATAPARALPPRTLADVDAGVVAGTLLPLQATFRDEHDARVRLADYFGDRPAIVVLGYYGCSNLCSLVLQGVQQALVDARLVAGRDVEIVVISIAPQETAAMARTRRRSVIGDDAPGWHFLVGGSASIDAITHALGYRYAYDTTLGQFAHAAGVTIVDAQGRVRSALPGIVYPSDQLRAALAPAPASKPEPRIPWLLCFGDDPHTGRHSASAMLAVRITGLGALAGLLACITLPRMRARRRRRTAPQDARRMGSERNA